VRGCDQGQIARSSNTTHQLPKAERHTQPNPQPRHKPTQAECTCSATSRSPSATSMSSVAVTGLNCGRSVCLIRRLWRSLKSALSSLKLLPARGGGMCVWGGIGGDIEGVGWVVWRG